MREEEVGIFLSSFLGVFFSSFFTSLGRVATERWREIKKKNEWRVNDLLEWVEHSIKPRIRDHEEFYQKNMIAGVVLSESVIQRRSKVQKESDDWNRRFDSAPWNTTSGIMRAYHHHHHIIIYCNSCESLAKTPQVSCHLLSFFSWKSYNYSLFTWGSRSFAMTGPKNNWSSSEE